MTYHMKQLTAPPGRGSPPVRDSNDTHIHIHTPMRAHVSSGYPRGYIGPIRVLFVYAVIMVALFLMAFIWLIGYAVIAPLRGAILQNMAQYDVANSSYQSFESADTFMNNLWIYLLVIVVFILLCWVYIYSQQKGEMLQ